LTFLAPLVAAAIAALSTVSPAYAKTPAEVFQEFELFGTWSPNCEAPPSATNPRVTWRPDGQQVLHTVTFDGRRAAIRDMVGDATVIDGQTLQITIMRSGKAALTVTMRVGEDFEQAVRSVGMDGHVFYDGGVDVATGHAALIDERCQASVS
jgi:hypothetical protein